MTTKRIGRPLLKQPHTCSVCGARFTKGGRAGDRPLCTMHYHRLLRGSPLAEVPDVKVQPEPGRTVTVYLPAKLVDALDQRLAMKAEATSALFQRLLRRELKVT